MYVHAQVTFTTVIVLTSILCIHRICIRAAAGLRHDDNLLALALIILPNSFAGGCSTNGKLEVKHIPDNINAILMDYVVLLLLVANHIIIYITLWPSNPYHAMCDKKFLVCNRPYVYD